MAHDEDRASVEANMMASQDLFDFGTQNTPTPALRLSLSGDGEISWQAKGEDHTDVKAEPNMDGDFNEKIKSDLEIQSEEESEEEGKSSNKEGSMEVKNPVEGAGSKGGTLKEMEVRKPPVPNETIEEPPEVDGEDLVERVVAKRKKRKDITKEMRTVSNVLETATESSKKRRCRLEVQANNLNRQATEISRQEKLLEEDDDVDGEVKFCMTNDLNDGLEEVKKVFKQMEANVTRLVDGKQGEGGRKEEKLGTLQKLKNSGKKFFIFCPGVIEEQPKKIDEKIRETDINIIRCDDDGIKKMVTAVKNIETGGGKDGKIGVFIMKCGKGIGAEEEVVKASVDKIWGQLNLVINRGDGKFEKQFVIIPPVGVENWKVMDMLEKKAMEKEEKYIVISMLGEQLQKGKEVSQDDELVWKKDDLAFAKKYSVNEEEKLCLNQFTFRRVLARLAHLVDPEDGQDECKKCGLTHLPDQCLI